MGVHNTYQSQSASQCDDCTGNRVVTHYTNTYTYDPTQTVAADRVITTGYRYPSSGGNTNVIYKQSDESSVTAEGNTFSKIWFSLLSNL
jgi:hypothetical protein